MGVRLDPLASVFYLRLVAREPTVFGGGPLGLAHSPAVMPLDAVMPLNKDVPMHETLSRKGLYDPRFEHDACGVGFVADLNNVSSHDIVQKGIEILQNLDHRGARGAEEETGDGAGILVQLPHAFLLRECARLGISLPEPGGYAVGQCFPPEGPEDPRGRQARLPPGARRAGARRPRLARGPHRPLDPGGDRHLRRAACAAGDRPPPRGLPHPGRLRARLFVASKYGTRMVRESVQGAASFYICSLSSRTVVYKGMLTPAQVPKYFPDLVDESFESALALIHSRFSTNVLPTWPLAHPFRTLAHNGEINTLRGNVNWMRSREAILASSLFSEDEIQKLRPVTQDGSSDSGILDNVVEFLMLGGRSLPHVMMMLIPEAWEKDPEIPDDPQGLLRVPRRAHRAVDGPASVAFSDGPSSGRRSTATASARRDTA